MLFNNFTDDIWGLKEGILSSSWIEMVAVRTILAWYMHMVLDPDIKQGLELMKYAENNYWKFRGWWFTARSIGLTQVIGALLAEVISIAILLSSDSYVGAVADFLALLVLNDLDNFLFDYYKNDHIHTLITEGSITVGKHTINLEDLFVHELTSSSKTKDGESDKELEPIFWDEATKEINPQYKHEKEVFIRPKSANLRWKDRDFCNKLFRF